MNSLSAVNQITNTGSGEPRKAEVEEQCSDIGLSLNELQNVVDTLAQRLAPVARPLPPRMDQKAGTAPEPMLVPLAHQLRMLNRALHMQIDALHQLHGSIEL